MKYKSTYAIVLNIKFHTESFIEDYVKISTKQRNSQIPYHVASSKHNESYLRPVDYYYLQASSRFLGISYKANNFIGKASDIIVFNA